MASPTKRTPSNKKADIVAPGNPNPGTNSTQAGEADTEVDKLLKQLAGAWSFLAPVRRLWWDRERLLITSLADSYSRKSARSHVTDGHLSTLAFERQARVAAQLPTGIAYPLTASDTAEEASTLMNLVINKYILPNANSQMDALTKLRMSGVYASMYGICPIMYDYRIDDEYIGPDFWILPARNFIPQPNKNSIRDCDWVMVSTMVSVSYLQAIVKRDKTAWDKQNVQHLIDAVIAGATPSKDVDSSQQSEVENQRTTGWSQGDTGPGNRVELITQYQKGKDGRWITFARDHKDIGVLRDIPNPHKNGRIPIVARQCFPLIDSIWGLGDFERGITLQKAKDSLINLYLDGVKLSIFPPLKIDVANATMSTIKIQAGARWLMKDPNAVTQFTPSAAGLETFQGTYQFLTGALLNQFGTTNTAISAEQGGNPAYGKTPSAIDFQQEREMARDNWDRFMLEKMLEDLLEGMINLLGENQEKPINFHIFDADVQRIVKEFGSEPKPQTDENGMVPVATQMNPPSNKPPKYMKMISPKMAQLTLPKSLLGGKYKFVIDASSTMAQDQEKENQTLIEILDFYFQGKPIIDQELQAEGLQFKGGQAIKEAIYSSGLQNPDKIIVELPQEDSAQLGPVVDVGKVASQFDGDPQIQDTVKKMFAASGVPPQGPAQPAGPQQPQMPMAQPAAPQMPQQAPQMPQQQPGGMQ